MEDSYRLLTLLREGGWAMGVLAIFSCAAMAVAVERTVVLARAHRPVGRWLARALRRAAAGEREAAARIAEGEGGAVGLVLGAALRRLDEPPERLERVLEAAAKRQLARLGRRLGVLASVASLAPLVGFLGTVTGMMASFGAIASFGLARPDLVASGIAEALSTTAGGLVVAIPAQLAYSALAARLEAVREGMEEAALAMMDALGR